MRPVLDIPGESPRLMKVALLGVTLDGKIPAAPLGYLDGFAVDDCFIYYSSDRDGQSIQRMRRRSF